MERFALRLSPRTRAALRELVAAEKLLRWQKNPGGDLPTHDRVLQEALLTYRTALGHSLRRHGIDWAQVTDACDREYRRRTGQPSPEEEPDDRAHPGTELYNVIDDDEE